MNDADDDSVPKHRFRMMLVTKALQNFPKGGRELLCKLNYDALQSLLGEQLVLYELPSEKLRYRSSLVRGCRAYVDGINNDTIHDALRTIAASGVKKVFVDGSNLGAMVRAVKKRFPEIEVITFFHNVEAKFFLGALRHNRSVHAAGILFANFLAESAAVHHSDKIICLSDRDSSLLRKIYGRQATYISPMALYDRMRQDFSSQEFAGVGNYALFVGGTFYANTDGIRWFVKNVAPRSLTKTLIVGRGFAKLRAELEIPGKVEVAGEVDDLSDWYIRSQFVIAPIFEGSGMKTKVAEALMFGKRVAGTSEAFSGYESIADTAGWVCNTAEEFVTAMNQAATSVKESYDNRLRNVFLSTYSFDAARRRLARIIRA